MGLKMALESARTAPSDQALGGQSIPGRLRRATPIVLILLTLAISLTGLYALGQSLRSRAGGPDISAAVSETRSGDPVDLAAVAKSLNRVGWSQPGVPVDVLLVTPAYFKGVGWPRSQDLNPDEFVIFLVSENIHDGDLPRFVAPVLYTDDGQLASATERVMAESPHHRSVIVGFQKELLSSEMAQLELAFPAGGGDNPSLFWDAAPVAPGAPVENAVFHVTGASILALLAGLVVSMWPCLFQLTAYFIPSLAGMSMQEARGPVTAAARFRVVKMASFFVLGFVIVYTLAGAAAGFAAQSFDTQSLFDSWRRPLTIVSGSAMLLLALRQAARARLPLVCKMPLMTPKRGKKGTSGYGTAMVMGLAYATGCATCFGAAVLLGMLVYVGVAGAPLTGAVVMFIFAVGMGIPLIIGSALMAHVLPLLDRFQNGTRYLSLASAGMMLFMAFLLLSDRFMGFSNFVSQAAG